MKRYAVFVARFALVPMIGGTFVVSGNGRASLVGWAHIITGFAAIYLIFGLLVRSWKYTELRMPAAVALALALLEAVPGMPRLHAAISPVLFAVLVWATVARPGERRPAPEKSLLMFALPALVLLTIIYGVGYRHQTSGFWPHIGAAMLAGSVVLICCLVVHEKHPDDEAMRSVSKMTIAAVLFQIAMGFAALLIRLMEIEKGLALGLARAAHITGAAPLLACCTLMAIQYRRRAA